VYQHIHQQDGAAIQCKTSRGPEGLLGMATRPSRGQVAESRTNRKELIMCQYFSCVSTGNGKPYYFNTEQREQIRLGKLKDAVGNALCADSHASIEAHYKLGYNKCNCYEYNPFTKEFRIDISNARKDDNKQIEKWCRRYAWAKTATKEMQEKMKFKPPLRKHLSKIDLDLLEVLYRGWSTIYPHDGNMILYILVSQGLRYNFKCAVASYFAPHTKTPCKTAIAAYKLYRRGIFPMDYGKVNNIKGQEIYRDKGK